MGGWASEGPRGWEVIAQTQTETETQTETQTETEGLIRKMGYSILSSDLTG